MAAAACLADGRRVCNPASFLCIFLLSLRWRAQFHDCASPSKINTVRFCHTSKGIRPVLRSSCKARVYYYASSKRRSRARGVINVQNHKPALRGARFFFVLSCCVGIPVSHLSTPLRRRGQNIYFIIDFEMIYTNLHIIAKGYFTMIS